MLSGMVHFVVQYVFHDKYNVLNELGVDVGYDYLRTNGEKIKNKASFLTDLSLKLNPLPALADQKTFRLWLWFGQIGLGRELEPFRVQLIPSHSSGFEHQTFHLCRLEGGGVGRQI